MYDVISQIVTGARIKELEAKVAELSGTVEGLRDRREYLLDCELEIFANYPEAATENEKFKFWVNPTGFVARGLHFLKAQDYSYEPKILLGLYVCEAEKEKIDHDRHVAFETTKSELRSLGRLIRDELGLDDVNS